MTVHFRIFLALSLLTSSSCRTLGNRINDIKALCGSDAESRKNLIQILDENGQPLNLEQARNLSFGILNSKNAFRKEGHLTSRSCIALENIKDDEQFIIGSSDLSLAGVASGSEIDKFSRIRLERKTIPTIQSECPDKNIFANQILKNPWKVTIKDPILYKMRIEARSLDSGITTTLFEKDFGNPSSDIPDTLPVENLPEGIYVVDGMLTSLDSQMLDKQSSQNRFSTKSCRVTLIHHGPEISKRDAESVIPISEPNEILTWSIPPNDLQTRYCLVPNPTLSDCAVPPSCPSIENFSNGIIRSPQSAGIYRSYYYHQDRAGNKSPIDCRTVIVSEKDFKIHVEWTKHEWNYPLATMDFPYAILEAETRLENPGLKPEDYLDRLECKVDFLSKGKVEIQGNDAVCLTGKCASKSLENFTPCSPRIAFRIDRAFEQGYAIESALRLHVRLNDGKNKKSIGKALIRINSSRWRMEKLQKPEGFDYEPDLTIVGGDIYALNSEKKELFKRSGNGWIKIPPFLNPISKGNFFSSQSGDWYAAWQGDPDIPNTRITRLEGEKWTQIKDFPSFTWNESDKGIDSLFLYNTTQNQVLVISDSNISLFPVKYFAQRSCPGVRLQMDIAQRRFAQLCRFDLQVQNFTESAFRSFQPEPQFESAEFTSGILMSDNFRFLIRSMKNGEYSKIGRFGFDKETFNFWDIPRQLRENCEISTNGQVFCNNQVWDSQTSKFVSDTSDHLLKNKLISIPVSELNESLNKKNPLFPLFDARKTYSKYIQYPGTPLLSSKTYALFNKFNSEFEQSPIWTDGSASIKQGKSGHVRSFIDNEWTRGRAWIEDIDDSESRVLVSRNNDVFQISRKTIYQRSSEGIMQEIYNKPDSDPNSSALWLDNPKSVVEDSFGNFWFYHQMSGWGFSYDSIFRLSAKGVTVFKFNSNQISDPCVSLQIKGNLLICFTQRFASYSLNILEETPQVKPEADVNYSNLRKSERDKVISIDTGRKAQAIRIKRSDEANDDLCRIFIRKDNDRAPIEIPYPEGYSGSCTNFLTFDDENLVMLSKFRLLKLENGTWKFFADIPEQWQEMDGSNFTLLKRLSDSSYLLSTAMESAVLYLD